jgi:hypothetical protein
LVVSPYGQKPLLDLLVYELDVVLESQDLCGELANDAGGDRLGWQGNTLRLSGGESLASDAVEPFDPARPQVGGDALVSRSPESLRTLVVWVSRLRGPLLFRSDARSKAGDSDKSASPRRVLWSCSGRQQDRGGARAGYVARRPLPHRAQVHRGQLSYEPGRR